MPAAVYSLYVDDSGTRLPDHVRPDPGEVSWFALGGILLKEEDEDHVRTAHESFYRNWSALGESPLHSHKIRNRKGAFAFIKADPSRGSRFMDDLTRFIVGAPVLGQACVIHRPGYMARYAELYGEKRWLLCKTAFSVLLERAAKYVAAASSEAKLRVYVERTDKTTDGMIDAYYAELRTAGMPFAETSAKYRPLTATQLAAVLYDLKFKNKSSPLMQLADLYLWPICKSGYTEERAYVALRINNRVIDCVLTADTRDELGVKYSCFDHEAPWARRPALAATPG